MNLIRLKYFQASLPYHNGMKLKFNYKKLSCMTKKHTTKQSMGQQRNQKLSRDKMKVKQNFPKSIGCCKSKSKRKGFPGGSVVKNLCSNSGDTGSIPDPERSHMPQTS